MKILPPILSPRRRRKARVLAPQISILDGVAQVNIFGSAKYAVRIQADPDALAARQMGINELVDAAGNPYDLTGKTAFSLCRCGGSVNKPFCDGTHSRIGFQAAESAVKAADEKKA